MEKALKQEEVEALFLASQESRIHGRTGCAPIFA